MLKRLLPLSALLLLLLSCATAPALQTQVADELDSYARLLDEAGQTAKSEQIAANAAQMRELQAWRNRQEQAAREGRAVENNFWLGFEPEAVLLEDAADRRRLGQAMEAERVERLAASYQAEQRAQIECILRK